LAGGWTYRPYSLRGRPFGLGVATALAPCNHSSTLLYVDVSMRRHRVKKEGKLLTNQTTVIVDITIRRTTLVRAAEQYVDDSNCLSIMRRFLFVNRNILVSRHIFIPVGHGNISRCQRGEDIRGVKLPPSTRSYSSTLGSRLGLQ
jgi:hypothetical protein